MTRATSLAVSALMLAALAALPLASAQHGPPPGYEDPAAYAQDYAAGQASQAQADPAGYAAGKATPEALGNETEHAAWLACWTLYAYAEDAEAAADPACARFFVAPGTVDAPAEAEATITETVNGTLDETGAQRFLDESLDAVNDTVADPGSALDQVQRILGAAVAFVQDLLGFVVGLVQEVLGLLGLGGKSAAAGMLGALDGLAALLGLPLKGLEAVAVVTGVADGAVAAVDGVASLLGSIGGGLASAAGAAAGGLGSLGQGLADGASSSASAVGDAVSGAAHAVGDAVHAVGKAVASLFGGDKASSGGSLGDGPAGGVRTGTEADGLLDRVLKLA
jgi:hypothetical protein